MESQSNGPEGICVGVRMRPLNSREINSGQEMVCKCENREVTLCKSGQASETYEYDKVFDEKSSTADVYAHIGKKVVEGVASGINGTIFAYGQTSSGKTHTMLGSDSQKGILEMAAAEIFNQIAESADRKFGMKVSFVEIYNEVIRDLLYEGKGGNAATNNKPADKKNNNKGKGEIVEIREDPVKGVYVETTEHIITEFSDIMNALKKGVTRRAVESTQMNEASSRSHTIFKLQLESEAEDGTRLISALNLVDLAGSESAKNTGAVGHVAKEGGKINQSLLSLSRVIEALSMNAKHVGFRDSKLTRLLQPSLSGNAKMAIICCITPARDYLEETKSTLLFAQGARRVKTHARVNEVVDDSVLLKRLTKEFELLKNEKQRSGVEEEQARVIAKLNQTLMEKETRIKRLNAHLFKNGLTLPTEEVPAAAPSLDSPTDSTGGSSSRVSFEPPTASEVRSKKRRAFSLCPSLANKEAAAAALAGQTASTAGVGGRSIDADILFPARRSKSSAVSEESDEVVMGGADATETSSNNNSLNDSTSSDCSTVPDTSLDHSDDNMMVMDMEEEEEEVMPIAPAPVAIDDSKIHAIEQRIQALLDQFANKEQVIAEKNRTIEELHFKLSEYENSSEIVSDELNALKETLTASETRLRDAESLVEEVQREKQILSQQLEENAAASQELEMQLTEQNAGLMTELSAVKEALAAAQQSLELQKEVLSTAEKSDEQLARKQEELESLQAEQEALGEELSEALNSVNALTTELTQAKEETAALKASLQATQSELEETKQMFDSLMNEKATEAAMEVETNTAVAAAAQLEEELSALREAMAAVSADKEQLLADKSDLQRQLDETMTGLIALNNDMTDMQEKLATEAAELQGALDRAKVEKTELSEQLEAELESGLALQQELVALQTALGEMTAERDALKESEQVLSAKCAALSAESEEMKGHVAMLRDELQSTKQELASTHQMIETLQQDKAALEGMDMFAAEREQMSAQLEAAEAERQSLLTDKASLEEEVGCFEETLKAMEEKCVDLETDNQSKAAEITRLNESIAQLESERAAMEEKVAAAVAAAASAAVSEEMQQELDQLKEKCFDWDGKCSDLSEQLSVEKNRVCSLLNEMAVIEVLKTKTEAALESALQGHEQQCSALNSQIATQQSSIGGLETQLSEVTRQLVATEEKLRQLMAAAAAPAATPKASVNAMVRFNESEISQETLDAVRRDNERAIETMRAELGQRDAEVSKLRGIITEWQTRAQVAEQSLAQNAHREVMSMDGDEAMRKRLGQLQTTVDLLKGERDTIAARLASVEQENKTRQNKDILHIENLEKRIADLMTKQQQQHQSAGGDSAASDSAKELQEATQRLRKAKDECAMLNGELAAQGKMVDQLTIEVSDLKQKLAAAQSALSAVESVEEYVERVDSLQSELTDARNDLEAANNSITSLEESIAELNAECENLSSQVTLGQQALQSAEEAKTELSAQISAMTEELDLCKQTEDELVKQLEELRELQNAQMDVPSVAAVAPVVADNSAALAEELELVKTQLFEVTQTNADLAAKLATVQSEGEATISQLNQRIADLAEELELVKESEAELDLQLDEANKKLLLQEAAAGSDSEDSVKLTQEINELNEQLDMFRERESEMESKLDSFIRQKSAQQSIIDSLEAQVANSAAQITQLTELNDVLTQQLSEITGQFDQSQESEKLLSAEILQLKTTIVEQEDLMADMENEVFQLKQELAAAQSSTEVEEELQSALVAKEQAEQQLVALNEELSLQKERYQQNEDIIQSLQEQIDIKDKRIQHLDTCKLTKDQMEKIKVMKEERKKFQEDAKMLKKQLAQLKVAYDEQKASAAAANAGSSKAGPSTDYVISDLKFQIVEVTQQLSQEQKITTLLKDKMKECSKQLQDYENERSAVIELLEKHGIDTVGLMSTLDSSLTSADDIASRSTLEQQVELVDAVSKLAEKLVSVQALLEKRESSKASKSAQMEENLKHLSSEVEELRMSKQVLEKRVESLKAAAKLAKEESSALSVETEELKRTIEEMKAEVSNAEKRVAQSSSNISSEIQVLEEENIELMKENKELRLELTRLKVAAPTPTTVAAPAAAAVVASTTEATEDTAVPVKEVSVGQKRAFGTDLSNASSSSSSSNSSAAKLDKPRLSALLSQGATETASAAAAASATPKAAKVARTRAKPVVEDTAECNQQ